MIQRSKIGLKFFSARFRRHVYLRDQPIVVMRDILQSCYLRRRVAHKQLARTSLNAVASAATSGTFRSDYDYEYEYEFFYVYPVRMPDCVRLSRQLVLSSKSRRRLDTNYEIFNKSRPPTKSSLQVKCSVQLVSQCFGDFVASCVVCLLNIPATDKML